MNVILLPGQSVKNRDWIEEVAGRFSKEGFDPLIHYYSHWESGDAEIDIDKESLRFLELAESSGKYVVFAKSVGTLLFFKNIEKLSNRPMKAVMLGFPNSLVSKFVPDIKKVSDSVDFEVLIYQKKKDPFGSLEEIRYLDTGVVRVLEYECIGEGDDNHHYSNLDYIGELVAK